MRTLRAARTAGLCLVLAARAHPPAAAAVDRVAKVAAGLKRAVELKGSPPLSYRLEDRTATVTLRLVQQRKLALDENVNVYLKSWKVPDNELTVREKVTLR